MTAADAPPKQPSRSVSFESRRWLTFLAAAVVALGAVLLRLPEVEESLWVDELHTAWAIHDDLADVAQRAAAGNQTPWYFWALWFWAQVAGDSEWALRLPSVLALAAACAMLVFAASRHRHSLLAGVLAGGLLAIDLNGIYFGTEARSYGWVVAAVTAAAWAAVEYAGGRPNASPGREAPFHSPQRADTEGGRRGWLVLCLLGLCTAMLLHPTAGIALLAVIALAAVILWQRRRRWSWSLGLAAIAAVLLPLLINAVVVSRVWQVRDNWSRFGVPRSAGELWAMWPWLVPLIPLIVWAILQAGRWLREPSPAGKSLTRKERVEQLPLGVLLLVAVAAGTLLCWWIAAYGGVPVWHRRYIVGLLPLLCWATADLWAATAQVVGRSGIGRGGILAMGGVIAVGMLLHHQQTLQLFRDPSVSLRGEDWRAAVAWVNQHREPSQPVYVGAELIESNGLRELKPVSPPWLALNTYLMFPVSGPYAIENAKPLASAEDHLVEDLNRVLMPPRMYRPVRVRWLIYRMAEPYLESLYRQAAESAQAPAALQHTQAASRSFGGVTVVRLETRW